MLMRSNWHAFMWCSRVGRGHNAMMRSQLQTKSSVAVCVPRHSHRHSAFICLFFLPKTRWKTAKAVRWRSPKVSWTFDDFIRVTPAAPRFNAAPHFTAAAWAVDPTTTRASFNGQPLAARLVNNVLQLRQPCTPWIILERVRSGCKPDKHWSAKGAAAIGRLATNVG